MTEGWCSQLASNPEGSCVSLAHELRPLQFTVVSIIPGLLSELGKWLWTCCVSSAPRSAAFHTGRGAAQSGTERTAHRLQLPSAHRLPDKMGLEKEKLDTSIIMDEDEFNRSIEPILSKKGTVYSAAPDRDPNDINSHLKVKSQHCVEWLFESETTKGCCCQGALSRAPSKMTLLFSCDILCEC